MSKIIIHNRSSLPDSKVAMLVSSSGVLNKDWSSVEEATVTFSNHSVSVRKNKKSIRVVVTDRYL